MSRYIDADAAIKRFEELHGNENTLLNSYNADWIVSFIEGQPTAEVQEVRHRHWKSIYEDAFRRDGKNEHWVTEKVVTGYRCSICDCYSKTTSSYCPDCGARMDEEEQK